MRRTDRSSASHFQLGQGEVPNRFRLVGVSQDFPRSEQLTNLDYARPAKSFQFKYLCHAVRPRFDLYGLCRFDTTVG
jgi:hypothetical protein